MNKLTIWFLLLPYMRHWGPPSFRKVLADLTTWLLPDENLKRMRKIIENIEATSQKILHDGKSGNQPGGPEGATASSHQRRSIMSLLRKQ